MLGNKPKDLRKAYLDQEGLKFLGMGVYKPIPLIIEVTIVDQEAPGPEAVRAVGSR